MLAKVTRACLYARAAGKKNQPWVRKLREYNSAYLRLLNQFLTESPIS